MNQSTFLFLSIGAGLAGLSGCEDPAKGYSGGGEPADPTLGDDDPDDPDVAPGNDTDADPDSAPAGQGLLGLFIESGSGPEDEILTVEFGSVEVRRRATSEWVVVSEVGGAVVVAETQARRYPLGETHVDVGVYDSIRIEVLGGTVTDGAGQEFVIDAYDGEPIEIDNRFCVGAAAPTQVDLVLGATASNVSSTSWTLAFDPTAKDYRSCQESDDATETIDDGTVDETDEIPPV